MRTCGYDDFHGLWGVDELPIIVGIPLSVVAGVGIINAVNLIDGVDGYSSGYGGTLMLGALMTVLLFYTMSSKQSCEILADKGEGLGASIDMQLYIVIGMGFAVTFGFYKLMKIQQNGGPCDEEGYPQGTRLWHVMKSLGSFSHMEKGCIWRQLTRLVDSRLLGGK